jgi:TolB protein
MATRPRISPPQKLSVPFAAAGLAALAAFAGCASEPAVAPATQFGMTGPPQAPEPSMRVAVDAHLTLFGELPDQSRVPFEARAASPMKQHTFTTEGADFDVDVSPDGKWLVFGSTRHTAEPDLYLKTIDGRAVTQLTSDPAADVQPCFSPDGRTVVFASYRSGNWDLWLVGLGGGQATQITHSPMHEVHPSFSPDGTRLVYCMYNPRAGEWELWTLNLGHPGSRKMIGIGLFPEWSPTGETILYQRARERGGRWFSIWRLDLENGEPRFPVELATSPEMALIQPSWKPDGQWITYGTARLGSPGSDVSTQSVPIAARGDIWIVKTDGTSPLQLTDGSGGHFGSVWSTDGRVYFTSLQNGSENIWSVQPLLPGLTARPAVDPGPTARLEPARPAGERLPGAAQE